MDASKDKKPAPVVPVPLPPKLRSFRVVVERIMEEELLVEAVDESAALDIALYGIATEVQLLNQNEWTPEIIYSEEIQNG